MGYCLSWVYIATHANISKMVRITSIVNNKMPQRMETKQRFNHSLVVYQFVWVIVKEECIVASQFNQFMGYIFLRATNNSVKQFEVVTWLLAGYRVLWRLFRTLMWNRKGTAFQITVTDAFSSTTPSWVCNSESTVLMILMVYHARMKYWWS